MAQRLDGNRTYKKIKSLGEGSYGRVFLVQGVDDESHYVIKQLSLDKMDEKEISNTLTEVQVLKTFEHPNIINFKEVYKTKKGKLCIVMEYAERGDLSMAISAQNGKHFAEEQILDWFIQICLALQYVHDHKVLHRDLKTQNIFLTKNGTAKLGDFGIACFLNNTAENAKTMAGTPFNLSPEIIDGNEYSYKSDIWSLGIILYELCALVPPFVANGFTLLAMKILKGQYTPIPNQYSKDLQNLISMLLQTHSVQRPTVSEILNLPFIKKRVKDPLIPVKDISNLSYHKEGRKPSESFAQHNEEQNIQYRSSRVQCSSRVVGMQNQSLRFLKSLYPESSKPKSLLRPELGNNNSLLPSINQPSFLQNGDLSILSNSKASSFLGEEDLFVARAEQRSPSEQRATDALESVQEAQRNIKRNLERINNSGHLVGIDHSAVFESTKPIKRSVFQRSRQSLEPLVKKQLKQKIVFRKVEDPELVPISARVTPGRFKSVNRKKSYFNVNQQLDSIHEDSTVSTTVKQYPSCSPDRDRGYDNNKANQRQERPRKTREDIHEVRKESEIVRPKQQNKIEGIRKDLSADVLKRKEKNNKMNKVNSAGLELYVRSPSYFSHGRAGGNEHATNASVIEEEDLYIKTKKKKSRKQRTDSTELDILNSQGEEKNLMMVSKGEDMRSLRNIEKHILTKKSPELSSPVPMHAESDRRGLLNQSQFSKRDHRKESLSVLDRETNANYYIKQEGPNYLTKQKTALEYINRSRIIVKGVLAAVNKVMADFETTDALYDKGFELNQLKENSEINYQRKRLSNLADRRSKILNQSHLDTSLRTDLATQKDYP